jgi:hypothetical protein
MSEDEYYNSEPNDDYEDDDILGDYLIEEVSDELTLVMMPKITFDYDVEFEVFYKLLKKCKNKEQMKMVLDGIISHTSAVAVLQHEIDFLQERAKDLEFNVSMMQRGQ